VRIVYLVLEIYLVILFARIILSWFPISPTSAFHPIVRALGVVTDPVLVPLRRVLPPMTVGGMGLDLSPLIVIVVIEILLNILR
jgi:YggT family protein